ncbi:MAG: transcription antitermination factor NusB [Microbacteriaceae bacterium]|nr:transcription antitermination factor NusB [Microbacteriaceae bacterium]
MSYRSKARKRAVDALYAAELRDELATELLDTSKESMADRQNQDAIYEFAEELVTGVMKHQPEIDEKISSLSQNWSMDRMPALDRAILRLAAYELMFGSETPSEVVISEAVELAGELSTENSATFVNGVLSAISSTQRPI